MLPDYPEKVPKLTLMGGKVKAPWLFPGGSKMRSIEDKI